MDIDDEIDVILRKYIMDYPDLINYGLINNDVYTSQARNEIKKVVRKINERKLSQTMARGYCTDRNSHKVLDPDLLKDIAEEIKKSDIFEANE